MFSLLIDLQNVLACALTTIAIWLSSQAATCLIS